MDALIASVLDAVAADDRPALVRLLHPYLHWTEAGVTVRGRTKVFARLAAGPPPAPPDSYELRDGQIYRWISTGVPERGRPKTSEALPPRINSS
ncbi:DUF4440 domain-containing protein [Actinoplanes sp. URMC 104]|uniref:DUF4440 domain-containing protein n=1 Tax=Actinoplanes sp. URMC 104 TaxID=3423409 RepID=UPI003F1DC36A